MKIGTTATAGRPRALRLALALVLVLGLAATFGVGQAQAQNGKVLILGSTVTGGAASNEAGAATAAGLGFDVVTDAQWSAMTTAQFHDYNALVLGDPTCSGLGTGANTANATKAVWGPAVDGNVLVVGTDEVFHDSQGGLAVTRNGIAFAANDAGKTGMYVSLSCYYHGVAPNTPVPMLSPFGTFTATGVGCYNDAHIVATHPALTGITDASLSNWSCSVHEALDSFPSDFLPLAIAENPPGGVLPGSRSFPDGTSGVPYILARGTGVRFVGQIDLTPDTATNPVGTTHTVTATVKENGVAQVGKLVTFRVIAGPNAGQTGTGTTNGSGQATFTYTGSGGAGTDQITAEYTDSTGALKVSNTVLKIWEGGPADTTAPTCVLTATVAGPPKQIQITVQDTGSGLASILVTVSSNADTVVPPFSVGTTSAVLITATKITQTAGSVVELTVTDVAGNKIVCDPVWPGAKAKAKAKKLTKKAALKKVRLVRQHIRTHW
jgi:hypothetical protein